MVKLRKVELYTNKMTWSAGSDVCLGFQLYFWMLSMWLD